MAAREVVDRYAATARGGDWEGAYGFFSEDVVAHVPGRSRIAGELRGRAAVIGYIDAARAKSHGAEVEVELVDTLASEERVMLLVRERFADGDDVVEIERANVYTVRDGAIAEVWIFEADQYAVDELMGEA
ncbi:MAG: nuclear transport factor 2 family protein [Nocardioidaceae bacterium]